MRRLLDYSAFLHTALMSESFFNSFRFSATLKEPINPSALQQAVNETIDRYPLIYTKLTKDSFWYYLESLDELKIEEDTKDILKYVNYHNVFEKAVSIVYKDNTVSVEIFHSVSDGGGAVPFFKELIKRYVSIISNGELVSIDNTTTYTESELEDTFARINVKDYPSAKKIKLPNTYQFPRRKNNTPVYVKRYTIDVKDIKEAATRKSGKINELLLTIFYKAIDRFKGSDSRNICLLSPVNLRQHFDSTTLRNFTLCASILFKDSYKDSSYEEIFGVIREQMAIQNSKQHMGHEISKLSKMINNPLVRICPTWLKNFGISFVYKHIGEKSCITVSNLGNVRFADEVVENYVEEMTVALSPRYSTPLNCGVISIHNKMIISICHDGLENQFFEELEKEFTTLGIPFQVSNV